MKPLHAVLGPSDAGPGERQEMLERARRLLEQAGADDVDRFDVPGRGAGEEGEGTLRPEVERIIPALQSGSLFGGTRGVLVMDAQNLQVAEAEIVATLIASLTPGESVVVLVSAGSLPSAVAKIVRGEGESHPVKKMREHDAAEWLGQAARERRVRVESDAVTALLQRFGSDVAALGQALDQLVTLGGPVTAADVASRFRNRPDEPMWHYADALAAGKTGDALRRLSDFLTHGHPLQLLAFVESDLKRRSLAAAAPSLEVFAGWVGARPDHYPVKKAWGARTATSEDDLRKALDAVSRADLALKTAPEATHRVMLERLTVALARWYRGRSSK
jgi:DNA polymerase III delta subunit